MTKKVKGVHWNARQQKWLVAFRRNRKLVTVGRFDNFEDAANVAKEWAQKNEFRKTYNCVKCGVKGIGSQFAPYMRKGHCNKCWEQQKSTKRVEHESAKHKICKRCGKPFYNQDKRQLICSLQCDGAFEIVACHVCGKKCRKSKARKYKQVACSAKCQHVLLQKGAERRAEQRRVKFSPQKHTRAKRRWYTSESARRKRNNKWIKTISNEMKRIGAAIRRHRNGWAKRCSAAISGLGLRDRRKSTICKKQCNGTAKEQGLLAKVAIAKMRGKRFLRRGSWQAKCENAICLQRKRQRQHSY